MIEMAAVDDLAHLAIEEGQQQGADVGAVDVGVGHDDDLVVAQLVGVELFADAGAERGDQGADLLARQHLVHAHALDVQDLAAQRQNGLEFAVAALLGGAAGGIALDDEDLGLRRIALLAVGELARQRRHAERALARHLARLAGGFAGGGRLDDLADDDLGFARMLLEPGGERLVEHALDHRADLGGDQLVLGLGREFGIRHLDRQHRGQALAAVVAGERDLLLAGDAAGLRIAGHLARQRAAEAGEMGAAVALRDVVGEAQHGLVVAVVPPHRAFDAGAVALGADHDRFRHQRRLVAVEISHERLDAALVDHLLALLDGVALVGQHDADAGIEERQFAQAVLQRRPVEFGHGEGLLGGQERHLGAAPLERGADVGERGDRLAVAELDHGFAAVAPDRELEHARQRVDDGDADAVQPARHLVGVLVEFSAGMELGHDDLGGRHALAVDLGRNAAAVVAHRAGAVRIEGDGDFLGVAGERLVDGVVDDLIDHVVQARAVIGVADIHAGALAHGIEALEDLDAVGAIVGGV